MDWGMIGGVAGVVGVLIALVAWLRPRSAGNTTSPLIQDPQPPLKVALSFGFLTLGSQLSPQMVFVDASVPGTRPFRLTGVGLKLPDGRTVVWTAPESSRPLGTLLNQTDSCRFWGSVADVGRSLLDHGITGPTTVRPFVHDSYGDTHYGEPKPCDPNEWAATT